MFVKKASFAVACRYRLSKFAAGVTLSLLANAAAGQLADSPPDSRMLTLDEIREALVISDSAAEGLAGDLTTKGGSVSAYVVQKSHADRIRDVRQNYDSKVIYGPDDRMDYGVAKNQRPGLLDIFNSSVALFDAKNLSPTPGNRVALDTITLGEKKKLCPGERFHGQAVGAFCTGVLISNDLVLTAGHCIREISGDHSIPQVEGVAFVFGFYAEDENDRGKTEFDSANIFYGKEAVTGVLDNTEFEDWGVVRLDKAVPPHIANPVSNWGTSLLEEGEGVYVVGYPTGLPLKYAPNSTVRESEMPRYFTANLDTFGGNSGSGVFRSVTNELVGILVQGETDYVWDRHRGCRIVNICPTSGCAGEYVTRAGAVAWNRLGLAR
jgi:V8-like Glu-specific endopeptidase